MKSTLTDFSAVGAVAGAREVVYLADEGRAVAQFAKHSCDNNGWTVPAGTLVSLTVFPKQRLAWTSADEAGLETANGETETYFFNRTRGIEYQIETDVDGGRYVFAVRRFPSTSDKGLRCRGFPEYHPVSEYYPVYDGAVIDDIEEWDAGLVFGTIQEGRENSMRPFIFVYCPFGKQAPETKRILARIDTFIRNAFRERPKDLTLKYGGFRPRCEFESFLVPAGQPDERPRPRPEK